MAPHACPNCRRLLHFEARVCPGCGFTLGYDPAGDRFLFLGDGATTWRDADGAGHATAVCANNNAFEVCNWLVETGDSTPFCRACRHNRTIPDLSGPGVPQRWGKVEAAKRRLFHSLIRLGLPLETQAEAAEKGLGQGLAFDILYDPAAETGGGRQQIMTGHRAGLITLNLIEADDAQRERIRTEMGEPYRTLLGHFRHEVAHHYWARLIEPDEAELDRFRQTFGDERTDYHAALQSHYGNAGGWSAEYVSPYATSHPWEDFAETFAHYLHMVDTLATIGGFGMRLDPFPGPEARPGPKVDFDPYHAEIRQLADHWIPISFALNAISRSMGQPDLYPFKLPEPVIGKLTYVRDVVAEAAGV